MFLFVHVFLPEERASERGLKMCSASRERVEIVSGRSKDSRPAPSSRWSTSTWHRDLSPGSAPSAFDVQQRLVKSVKRRHCRRALTLSL